MYYLLISYSQDCETQNEIIGVYSNLFEVMDAIIRDLIAIYQIDNQEINEEQTNFLIEELSNVLNKTSTLYKYFEIEIDKDMNIQE